MVAGSALLALATTGCSTYFYGSAPAGDGQVYVVGGKQGFFTNKATVWLCPADGSQAECERVEVVTE
jgi:hypothetical protein